MFPVTNWRGDCGMYEWIVKVLSCAGFDFLVAITDPWASSTFSKTSSQARRSCRQITSVSRNVDTGTYVRSEPILLIQLNRS